MLFLTFFLELFPNIERDGRNKFQPIKENLSLSQIVGAMYPSSHKSCAFAYVDFENETNIPPKMISTWSHMSMCQQASAFLKR